MAEGTAMADLIFQTPDKRHFVSSKQQKPKIIFPKCETSSYFFPKYETQDRLEACSTCSKHKVNEVPNAI
jgi:hypothetical protein